ncbi:MAG: DNA translocase FtsK 4TM domain-containing protein, partial [Chlamydiota bacterium]|nr:DNA translocase FtsK 4TM domain-containing protein [Chlamydiota bacterium]
MAKTAKKLNKSSPLYEVWAVFFLGLCVFVFLALYSYDPRDVAFTTTQVNNPPHNYIGLIGAWFSFVLLTVVGLSSYLIPVFSLVWAVKWMFLRGSFRFVRDFFYTIILLTCCACLLEIQHNQSILQWCSVYGIESFGPGGFIGEWLMGRFLMRMIGLEGSLIVIGTVVPVTMMLVTHFRLA